MSISVYLCRNILQPKKQLHRLQQSWKHGCLCSFMKMQQQRDTKFHLTTSVQASVFIGSGSMVDGPASNNGWLYEMWWRETVVYIVSQLLNVGSFSFWFSRYKPWEIRLLACLNCSVVGTHSIPVYFPHKPSVQVSMSSMCSFVCCTEMENRLKRLKPALCCSTFGA